MTESEYQNLIRFLSKKFDRIDARFDALDGRVGRVEGRLTRVEGRLTKVEGRLTKLEFAFEEHRHDFRALAELVQSNTARIGRLEELHGG